MFCDFLKYGGPLQLSRLSAQRHRIIPRSEVNEFGWVNEIGTAVHSHPTRDSQSPAQVDHGGINGDDEIETLHTPHRFRPVRRFRVADDLRVEQRFVRVIHLEGMERHAGDIQHGFPIYQTC